MRTGNEIKSIDERLDEAISVVYAKAKASHQYVRAQFIRDVLKQAGMKIENK